MDMKKIGVILLLGAFAGFAVVSKKQEMPASVIREEVQQQTQQQEVPTLAHAPVVDKRAAFAIYTRGTFRIFTAAMYHNLSPDVYIEARNPNIIQVKKAGVTWNDFFKTLPFSLTKNCLTTGTKETFCTNGTETLMFYLNGEENEVALDQIIEEGDKLLVTYGNKNPNEIQKQLQRIPDP